MRPLASRALTLAALGALAACTRERPSTRTEPPSPEVSGETVSAKAAASAAPASAPASAATPVALAAAPTDAAAPEPEVPRIYAKTRFVWIYPIPDTRSQWIGFMRTGQAARLRGNEPKRGPGCAAFYAIEPIGYVCADGRRATLDPDDPLFRALAPYAARVDSPWPHRYGESLGAARYFSTPTESLQKMREGDLRAHRRDVERARAGDVTRVLRGVDLTLPEQPDPGLPPLPITVFEDRRELKPRSTVAYTAEARFGDRGFLLSSDFAWIPKDRVRPYPKIEFHGLELGGAVTLPLAFFRGRARPKFQRDTDGHFSELSQTFPRLAHVALTGKSERVEDTRYFETAEPGVWVRERDAVIPKPRAKVPWGVHVNDGKDNAHPPSGRATWLDVSIDGGWLIAYEGTRPVFTTLISPGKGGPAEDGEDPLVDARTPLGTFPITGKFVSSTMEAPGPLIHSDVPFAQNLVGPYALHGAYWHDNWGVRQSGGCINLSPIDAKWLFDFTEPKMPEDWYGVRWLPDRGPATIVVLHK